MKPNLETAFAGLVFKNPIVLASGTCGFGREYSEFFDLGKLGGICSKGLTLHGRTGNTGIRVWESASGIMNSIGLENPGVENFIKHELGWMNSLGTNVIVNLGGHCMDDYIKGAELLNKEKIDILELNISCPNIKSGGMSFGIKTLTAREVVREIRRVCGHRLVVKLSPNAEDIVSMSSACEEEGADGISLVNTFLAMAIDVQKRAPVFDNTYAGLSGPAIKPIALRIVHQVAAAVNIPIMGIGGVANWRDALEFIMAGASIVQIGTANFINPSIALEIISGMETWLESQGIDGIGEIRRAANTSPK